MTWIIGRVIALGVPPAFAKPLLGIVAALALIVAFVGLKSCYDHGIIDKHEAKVEQQARPATDKAASERATDAITNAKNDQERHDAIEAQPDQPIAPTSRALSCKRLRDAGRNPPACR